MRVTCRATHEFVENLIAAMQSGESVLRKTVHVDTTRQPLGGSKRESMAFDVVFQASAVLELPDGGEYILEAGEDCGRDLLDGEEELNGTERAAELRGLVRGCCEANGLSVRPGLIDM